VAYVERSELINFPRRPLGMEGAQAQRVGGGGEKAELKMKNEKCRSHGGKQPRLIYKSGAAAALA